MESSPEEQKWVHQEQKPRLAPQEKAKKELEVKKTRQRCLESRVVVLISAILMIALAGGLLSSCCDGTTLVVDLKASVRFTGTDFLIRNEDAFDWTNVKLELNGAFGHNTQRIPSGTTYTVHAVEFAKGDGTRFNPLTMKPLKFMVWCDTPKGEGSWIGEYE